MIYPLLCDPYLAIHFDFDPECILNPLFMSTLVGDSIVARRVYKGRVMRVYGRKTLVYQIELYMLDFNVNFGWTSYSRTMRPLIFYFKGQFPFP